MTVPIFILIINHFHWPIAGKLKLWRPTQVNSYIWLADLKNKKPSNFGALTQCRHFYYDNGKSLRINSPFLNLLNMYNDQLKRLGPFTCEKRQYSSKTCVSIFLINLLCKFSKTKVPQPWFLPGTFKFVCANIIHRNFRKHSHAFPCWTCLSEIHTSLLEGMTHEVDG
jgi:hypothetical protein